MENNNGITRIVELENKIEIYNKAYYDENKSLVSDYEYDLLKKELEQLRKQNNGSSQQGGVGLFGKMDIPIEQQVGYRSNSKFAKIQHKKRMMSLANALTLEEFYDFVDKTKRFLKIDYFPESVCELKIDGLSFSAMYNYGKLKYVATRGDGVIGEDVSNNVLQIDTFPQELVDVNGLIIQPRDLEEFEVRGEIYMPKEAFEKLNNVLDDKEKFSNPRNAASGTLRQLDATIVKDRGLSYYTYFIGECSERITSSQSESLELLQKLGFVVNTHWKVAKSVEEIIDFHKQIEEIRYNLDCDIDGVVVKINDFAIQNRLGNTAHDPRWAIAYKFSGVEAITKLVGITAQVGRTGIVTPVAELMPVNIGGVIVKRATLHNYDEIKRLGLHIGDLIVVKRSGDVIPKILSVNTHCTDGEEIKIPTQCPCCGSLLEKDDKFVAVYCPNHNGCKSQIVDRIRHFASRNGLDIVGLGRQTISLFYDLGFLRNILDIFSLYERRTELEQLEGFGEKSTQNLITSIEESKKVYFNKVLYAIGIDEVGENVAKILARYYMNFSDILADCKEFSKIRGVNGLGEQMIGSLIDYFNNPENLQFIEQLNGILNILPVEDTGGISLNGKSVVFTGKLQTMTRQQAKIQAEQLGYKVLVAVSSNTDYLVYGADAGAAKLEKATAMGVKLLTEAEWNMLNNGTVHKTNQG